MSKNVIFILLDSLRFDTVEDEKASKILFPNIARVQRRGFTKRVTANAQATQFVMPSIFSQSYPLDYGGYNNGIRERPASFVECIRKSGYSTFLMSACNQIGVSNGYDRGFEHLHTAIDYRHILEYRLEKTLSYDLDRLSNDSAIEGVAWARIKPELEMMLRSIVDNIENSDKVSWPHALRRMNTTVGHKCLKEIELLGKNPEAVFTKIRKLRPRFYWRFLGEPTIDNIRLFKYRVLESLSWRSRRFLTKFRHPFFFLAHHQVVSHDQIEALESLLSQATRPHYIHIHWMDLHDFRSLSRPLVFLRRLKFLIKWLLARRRGLTDRHWAYDLAVMDVDQVIGRILDNLESTNSLEDTIILITADHGYSDAGSPRRKNQDLGFRTHYEDIDVPLIMSDAPKFASDCQLLDSMDISASLLDALAIEPHPAFKGRSVFDGGKNAVISENAGRGNADIERRNLYFTITSETHKLMVLIRGNIIEMHELYDLIADPKELFNIIAKKTSNGIISELIDHLLNERPEIMQIRGVTRGNHRVVHKK